jgi:hypothetical protein
MKYLDTSKNIVIDGSVDVSNNIIPSDITKINNFSPDWGIMLTLQGSLNVRIGTQAWKKYISAAFWNYISTPINFTITLFTALTAGQTGTGSNYLSERQLFIMLFISFLLSIVNTFFKLKEKALLNYEASKKYDEFGAIFEEIYYMPLSTENDMKTRLSKYKVLQEEINKYSQKERIENVNYFTELIYLCFYCLFNDNLKRINKTDRFWYLDGMTPDITRKRNPWEVDLKEYFKYDISGHCVYIDEEEMKEKRENQRKQLVRSPPPYPSSNRYYTAKKYQDLESGMIEYLGKSRIEKYLEKSRMEKFEKNSENAQEEKKSNEIKMMFVQEKIQDCMMRKQSDDTRKKLSKIMLNSCADASLNNQEYDRAKEFLQDVNISS